MTLAVNHDTGRWMC